MHELKQKAFEMLYISGEDSDIGIPPAQLPRYQEALSRKLWAPVFGAVNWRIINIVEGPDGDTNQLLENPRTRTWVFADDAVQPEDFEGSIHAIPTLAPCVGFHESYIIETEDCIFVLVGRGRVVEAPSDLVRAASFYESTERWFAELVPEPSKFREE